jgi:phage baseplate assembly protein W
LSSCLIYAVSSRAASTGCADSRRSPGINTRSGYSVLWRARHRSDFGSLLFRLRHQKNDSVLQELARVYVVDALKRWEPRIVVTDVAVGRLRQDSENVLAIRIRYDVISTNTPGNNVILSGIDQTVRL